VADKEQINEKDENISSFDFFINFIFSIFLWTEKDRL
jgi:hypothetical protein